MATITFNDQNDALQQLAAGTGITLTQVGAVNTITGKTSRLAKNVAGSADVVLTATEGENDILDLSGVIGANINLIVPLATTKEWTVRNGTTGAFTLTVKGASGTGVVIATGKTAKVFSDGTNIVRITADNP